MSYPWHMTKYWDDKADEDQCPYCGEMYMPTFCDCGIGQEYRDELTRDELKDERNA